MNKLQKILGVFVLGTTLGLAGCQEERIEYSPVLHEEAKVVDAIYIPSKHGSGMSVSMNLDDGSISPGITSIDIKEKYAVIFKCQHGKFIIEGTDEPYKKLWEKMTAGEKVKISYKEKYYSVYDDTNNDGTNELIEKKLIKYDFLDAQPITNK